VEELEVLSEVFHALVGMHTACGLHTRTHPTTHQHWVCLWLMCQPPLLRDAARVYSVCYIGNISILCIQASEEKASALMRISAAEETATQAFEEVGNMRDEIADLKVRLQKVRRWANA